MNMYQRHQATQGPMAYQSMRQQQQLEAAPDLREVTERFSKKHTELVAAIDKANGQLDENKKVSTETKAEVDKLGTDVKELAERVSKAEAKAERRRQEEKEEAKSLGIRFAETAEYKEMSAGKAKSARMQVKAITNTLPPSNDAPLVPAQRLAGIIKEPDRDLRIRDLLPTGRTTSNLIEYAKENVFTNNAGPQVGESPTVQAENVTKPESDITFTLANAPVITLAHFLKASRQVLSDAAMLGSYIDQRLTYGLKFKEEDQILNGDGDFGNLSGLRNNGTAYTRHVAGDTRIDTLRRSITQLQLANQICEVFVLNPADWEKIELQKDSQSRYIMANPQSLAGPLLWGRPVVPTNSMPVGNFMSANLSNSAMLWDREDASIELSREDDTNFQKNMVTILAEERLALTVFLASGLIVNSFPQGI